MRKLALGIFLLAAPALADGTTAAPEPLPGEEDEPGAFTFGVAVIAPFGANFIDQPGDRSVTQGGQTFNAPYPGFAGFSAGIGISGDIRYHDIIGLEVDFYSSNDRGKGSIENRLGTTLVFSEDVEVGQRAWHLPILLRLGLPLPLVEPFLLAGPEIVLPQDPEASPAEVGSTKFTAEASTYTMITVGLGAEIRLPIPSFDLRIPISLRGSINPGSESALAERADYTFEPATCDGQPCYTFTEVKFNTEWQYRAVGTIGLMARF